MKPKTWMVEHAVVALILATVVRVTGGSMVEWIGAAAVLCGFGHASVSNRLAEREAARAAPEVKKKRCGSCTSFFIIPTQRSLDVASFFCIRSGDVRGVLDTRSRRSNGQAPRVLEHGPGRCVQDLPSPQVSPRTPALSLAAQAVRVRLLGLSLPASQRRRLVRRPTPVVGDVTGQSQSPARGPLSDPLHIEHLLYMTKYKAVEIKEVQVKRADVVVATIVDAGVFGFAVHSDHEAVRRGLITYLHRSASSVQSARAHVHEAIRAAKASAA